MSIPWQTTYPQVFLPSSVAQQVSQFPAPLTLSLSPVHKLVESDPVLRSHHLSQLSQQGVLKNAHTHHTKIPLHHFFCKH